MNRSGFGCGLGSHGPPDVYATSGSGRSAVRIRLGTLAATLFAIVLASLAVVLAGGFGAQPANAQSAAQTSPWGWGWNGNGQLGDGTNNWYNYTAVQPSGLSDVIDISAGDHASYAVKSDKTAWAWGWNLRGTLGDGTNTDRYTPVQVSGLTDVKAISGGYLHALALENDGTVWAWGYNQDGELGNGTGGTGTDSNVPVQPWFLSDVGAIAAGGQHSLALKNDGTVYAWGFMPGGIGDGSSGARWTPIQVEDPNGGSDYLTGVQAIAAGYNHSLVLKSDGTVWAWGGNASGQLGDGTKTNAFFPVQVKGLTDVKAIAAGNNHSVAVKNDGTVYAWGGNDYGQLGDGTNAGTNTPVQVSGLSGATDITAGIIHSVALKSDGTAWAWGYNHFGQLGNGSGTDSNTPVQVSVVRNITEISAGGYHTMSLAEGPPPPPDTTKPSVTLSTPTEGAVYKLNADVRADYSCADEMGGSGLKSCTATPSVDSGQPIDTSTLGTKTFTVTAEDNAGNTETVTHTYNVTRSGKTQGGGPRPR